MEDLLSGEAHLPSLKRKEGKQEFVLVQSHQSLYETLIMFPLTCC